MKKAIALVVVLAFFGYQAVESATASINAHAAKTETVLNAI